MEGAAYRDAASAEGPALRPSRRGGGTGDVAFRVLEAGGPATQVTVLDINESMLRVGAERAAGRYGERIGFVTGNAETLPLPDETFDAYTIAFGIRNVPRIEVALEEARRVLKPGGRFLCLEFSAVDVPLLDKIYEAYSSTSSRASASGWPVMRTRIGILSNRSASSRAGAPSPG